VQLGVSSQGQVAVAKVDGVRDDDLAWCVRDSLMRWEFSAPRARGLSILTTSITFRPPRP